MLTSNLPARSRVFVGRAELLVEIQRGLETGRVAVVALQGLGGLGKSAAALEFAHQGYDAHRFSIAWWIRAESAVTLVEDLAGLAPALGLEAGTDQDKTVRRVLAALRSRRDWLIVFDNVIGPDTVRGWLPARTGSTLITSRVRGWDALATSVSLGEFPRKESLDYFRQAVRQHYEAAAADQLAELLGDLPLALAQAAGYMNVHDLSVAGYLGLYRDRNSAGQLLAEQVDGYPASVATTWLLHYDQLARDKPASLELLRLCSFLDPEDIDLGLVLSAREFLPPQLKAAAGDPRTAEDAVGELIRTGLANRISDQHVRFHRLVAQVTRLHLADGGTADGEGAHVWAGFATAVVNALFPGNPRDPATWQLCAYLAAHASAAVEHADDYGALDAQGDALLARLGAYLQSQVAGEVVSTTGLAAAEEDGRRGGRVQSAYDQVIRRIAPGELVAREEELKELADFCARSGNPSYMWLQAPPWSGKSALLAWFVQFPPPDVVIASSFITARLAAQDTSEAFTAALLEQLAALLGQTLPTDLTGDARQRLLLDLMPRAAAACQDDGRRLVLIVDGLDEDRGATAGPDARSIAGLLPSNPPAGMRVIVASRANHPLPDDVPDSHPLRDPAVVHELTASAHARDLQRLSRQELQRLLRSDAAERDPLGLLVAARGGLTAADLTELTGIPLWEAEEALHTSVGRTFLRHPARWNPTTNPETYTLGHEELQAAAERYLQDKLPGYREQLHAWADTYRTAGWPADTPQYLLNGYPALLASLGDVPRMTALALNPARHDRMLEVTGGDAAALAETRAALDSIAAQDEPDLFSALALGRHRDHLTDRNAHIPATLPAAWAALGQLSRAEALAHSITDPGVRLSALARVAVALAEAGRREEAKSIAEQIGNEARSVTGQASRERPLAEIARALARTRYYDDAEALASSITSLASRGRALARIGAALGADGLYQRAEALTAEAETTARSLVSLTQQEDVLVEVAEALAETRQYAQADTVARSITSPASRGRALARIGAVCARTGLHQQAEAFAAEAETAAHSITDKYRQARVLAAVVVTLADARQHQQASDIAVRAQAAAHSVVAPAPRASALAEIAVALTRAGNMEEAANVAAQAEAVARSVVDPERQERILVEVANALAQAGHYEQAEALARSTTDLRAQLSSVAQLAVALAEAGHREEAERMSLRAEGAARLIISSAAYERGLYESAMAEVARALARTGHYEEAGALARSIHSPDGRMHATAGMAGALARAGHYEEAEVLARSISSTAARGRALARIGGAFGLAGLYQQAEALVSEAQALASPALSPEQQEDVLAEVAEALAEARHYDRAEALARSISEPESRGRALARIAVAAARAGEVDYASRTAVTACAAGRWEIAAEPVLMLAPSAISLLKDC